MIRTLKLTSAAAARIARAVFASGRTSVAATGLALGIGVWILVQSFLVNFGLTPDVSLALLCSFSLSFVVGRALAGRFPALAATGLATIVASGWLALLPSVTSLAMASLEALPSGLLLTNGTRIACLVGIGFLIVGCPAACCGIICEQPFHRRHGSSFPLAVGGGLLLAALIVGPQVGLAIPAYVLALLAGASWVVQQWKGSRNIPQATDAGDSREISGRFAWLWRLVAGGTTFLVAGLIAGILARVLVQLMPGAPFHLAAGAGALIVGAVAGSAVHSWRRRRRNGTGDRTSALAQGNLPGALVIAAGGLLPLACFESLISLQLHANGYVSSVAVLLLIRTGVVALCFLPLGFGMGLIGGGMSSRTVSGLGGRVLSFCGGLAVVPWLIAMTGPVALMLAAAGTVVGTNVPAISLGRTHRWWRGFGYAGAFGLLALLGTGAPNYAPARAAALLFDGSRLRSWMNGVPKRLLTVLDDARLVAERETPRGTLTTWKSRGSVYLYRLDGVPLAVRQTQPALGPRPAAEVLRVLLPIVLHDDPQSLLILSDPGGVAARIAAAFPLRRVVCCERNVRESAVEWTRTAPAESHIIRRRVNGRLALLSEDRGYDIIVSSPGHPAIFGNAAQFTRGFYRDAAARLTTGGIFCQRVRYTDLGPEPLRVIIRTMRSAFGQVAAMELEQGVLALFGTNDPSEPLFRGLQISDEELAERFRRPQVRRLLASMGWDWSTPFGLKVIPAENLASFVAGNRKTAGVSNEDEPFFGLPINTAVSGRLAHRLPLEMMRWGAKGAELAHATAGLTKPLLPLSATSENRAKIESRITMVGRQHELMVRFADQPWVYRKVVKQHLEESPRSTIEKVDGQFERVLHPVEQRRLDYFAALDTAIRELDEPALAALEEFADPYDPMITYFLHHEIAPLYQELGTAGRRRQLVHRLRAAYFADPRDRSIRNIVTTITLVADHPRVIPDPTARYDQLNALVELLLRRWEQRGREPGSPEQTLVDVGKSLDALVGVLPLMEELAPAAGVSAGQWTRRADAIERMLTGPLRDLRVELLPHQGRPRKTAGKEEIPGSGGEVPIGGVAPQFLP